MDNNAYSIFDNMRRAAEKDPEGWKLFLRESQIQADKQDKKAQEGKLMLSNYIKNKGMNDDREEC